MRLAILILLCIGAVVAFGAEVLRFGEARRRGALTKLHYRRLRRRIKGLLLLPLFYVLGLYHEEIFKMLQLDPRGMILYGGLALIILVWILILAARDLHETAEFAAEESRRIRGAARQDLEKIIEERLARGKKSGHD